MADRSRSRRRGTKAATAMPAWVKVLAALGLLLGMLFVILHLTGHGFGPQMHMPHS